MQPGVALNKIKSKRQGNPLTMSHWELDEEPNTILLYDGAAHTTRARYTDPSPLFNGVGLRVINTPCPLLGRDPGKGDYSLATSSSPPPLSEFMRFRDNSQTHIPQHRHPRITIGHISGSGRTVVSVTDRRPAVLLVLYWGRSCVTLGGLS